MTSSSSTSQLKGKSFYRFEIQFLCEKWKKKTAGNKRNPPPIIKSYQ